MDQITLQQHLEQAEERVVLGERHVAGQRELVAKLKRDGQDSTEARRLLTIFEKLQVLLVADRDQLQRELAAIPP